jgi:hypothetical protein
VTLPPFAARTFVPTPTPTSIPSWFVEPMPPGEDRAPNPDVMGPRGEVGNAHVAAVRGQH